MGRRSLPPPTRHQCRNQSRKPWRERPRRAHCQWPCACPEGSLTPWQSVPASALMIAPPASTRSVPGAPESVLKSGHSRPDDLVLFVRDIHVAKSHSFRCDDPTRCGVRGDPDRCSLWSTHPSNDPDGDGCADHHAIDARSVLGTVQGSSLRSARACARHSGLDGACAQITSCATT